jgi:hypothetical protein
MRSGLRYAGIVRKPIISGIEVQNTMCLAIWCIEIRGGAWRALESDGGRYARCKRAGLGWCALPTLRAVTRWLMSCDRDEMHGAGDARVAEFWAFPEADKMDSSCPPGLTLEMRHLEMTDG